MLSVPTATPMLAMKQPTPHPSKIEDDMDSHTDTWGRDFKVVIYWYYITINSEGVILG